MYNKQEIESVTFEFRTSLNNKYFATAVKYKHCYSFQQANRSPANAIFSTHSKLG